MKANKTFLGLATALVLAIPVPALAGAYLMNGDSQPVKNEKGQCWRTVEWRPDLALRECDPLYWAAAERKRRRAAGLPDIDPGAAQAAPAETTVKLQVEVSDVTPPAPEVVEEVQLQPLVLNTDTSFRFGDYRLTAEGRDALQSLAGLLAARQAQELKVKITGHTDRVGNPKANQLLGLRRAQAIKEALVEMGLEGELIEVASKGASEPVTGKDDCPNSLVKCELIDCLRPDRRVVVETRAKVAVKQRRAAR